MAAKIPIEDEERTEISFSVRFFLFMGANHLLAFIPVTEIWEREMPRPNRHSADGSFNEYTIERIDGVSVAVFDRDDNGPQIYDFKAAAHMAKRFRHKRPHDARAFIAAARGIQAQLTQGVSP